MDTINNLVDLLIYQVQNLYAAEEQMQKAMPAIIERAQHSSLKNALQHHLQLTEEQKDRLQQVMQLLQRNLPDTSAVLSQGQQSKGMTGLIEELNEVSSLNLASDVTDAAIIAYVQKMEHYEISTYGTAHAFAKQMHLHEAENLLSETLKEEYDADDLLTALATAALNKEAIPEALQADNNLQSEDNYIGDVESRPAKVSISERSINSPGGRAGTSHRRYGSGESRGH
jgi:ferritin-like metal-binding protein YciE